MVHGGIMEDLMKILAGYQGIGRMVDRVDLVLKSIQGPKRGPNSTTRVPARTMRPPPDNAKNKGDKSR